ncbi:hypothetical protein B0H14DRAFT_2594564 [Mycena olivaceomarginata]|nr:hypothetical protein B0H14DRAFT_2594564 [Mycena olivaceomarginata]
MGSDISSLEIHTNAVEWLSETEPVIATVMMMLRHRRGRADKSPLTNLRLRAADPARARRQSCSSRSSRKHAPHPRPPADALDAPSAAPDGCLARLDTVTLAPPIALTHGHRALRPAPAPHLRLAPLWHAAQHSQTSPSRRPSLPHPCTAHRAPRPAPAPHLCLHTAAAALSRRLSAADLELALALASVVESGRRHRRARVGESGWTPPSRRRVGESAWASETQHEHGTLESGAGERDIEPSAGIDAMGGASGTGAARDAAHAAFSLAMPPRWLRQRGGGGGSVGCSEGEGHCRAAEWTLRRVHVGGAHSSEVVSVAGRRRLSNATIPPQITAFRALHRSKTQREGEKTILYVLRKIRFIRKQIGLGLVKLPVAGHLVQQKDAGGEKAGPQQSDIALVQLKGNQESRRIVCAGGAVVVKGESVTSVTLVTMPKTVIVREFNLQSQVHGHWKGATWWQSRPYQKIMETVRISSCSHFNNSERDIFGTVFRILWHTSVRYSTELERGIAEITGNTSK